MAAINEIIANPEISLEQFFHSLYPQRRAEKFFPIISETIEYVFYNLRMKGNIDCKRFREFQKVLGKKMLDKFVLGYYCKIETQNEGILLDSLKECNLLKYSRTPLALYVSYTTIYDVKKSCFREIFSCTKQPSFF